MALDGIRANLTARLRELERWQSLSESTDLVAAA
jgi:hypothetical protein